MSNVLVYRDNEGYITCYEMPNKDRIYTTGDLIDVYISDVKLLEYTDIIEVRNFDGIIIKTYNKNDLSVEELIYLKMKYYGNI